MGQRKLQIFLSSTYEDLIDERLAAMEAILAAGHIPAAMEQFTPGDETAWEKIKRWIDESDAYILILGARYGSLEPASGKSYVHLEYDYALEQKKPFMSLVITDKGIDAKVARQGRGILEQKNEAKLRDFKELVTKSHCGFWTEKGEIQALIYRKSLEWNARPELKGWVRAEEAASPEAMNELARLSSENHHLREQLSNKPTEMYDGATFAQLVHILRTDVNLGSASIEFTKVVGRELLNAGDLFEITMEDLAEQSHAYKNVDNKDSVYFDNDNLLSLIRHNLAVLYRQGESGGAYLRYYRLTDLGRRLRNQLLIYGDKEKRYRELWHVPDSETPSSES